ncbi:GTP-binding protein [Variovorax sp. E3]|uniref:CobW family GTP-binding protein n=1 Tax=Variovorax sp. E3 TaxID=1914993 RepID=UPI0018DE12E8|nr:GTP-binding protein [Variovorax sp. E3]
MTNAVDPRIPVTLLTGFLGSGKTTVLNHLLHRPELADTAVIINEFGEIGIDHLLVEQVGENLRVLNSGCLCCTVRGDLIDTLRDLDARRERGEIAAFARVVIETTGLADPAPVLHTLMVDPAVTPRYRLDGVVTTVDAVNGAATLDHHAEAVKQAAVADRLLLTKTDLVTAAAVDALAARLVALNPTARISCVIDGDVVSGDVLGAEQCDPLLKSADVRAWLAQEAHRAGHRHAHDHSHDHHHHHHDVNRHDDHIRAHCIVLDAPLQEAAFLHWLDLMAVMRGEKLLRVKGLVQVAERPDEPLVVHGVQHVFHPPRRLPAWPSADRRTRLVFITRDIAYDEIARTFQQFAGVRLPAAQPLTPHGALHHD